MRMYQLYYQKTRRETRNINIIISFLNFYPSCPPTRLLRRPGSISFGTPTISGNDVGGGHSGKETTKRNLIKSKIVQRYEYGLLCTYPKFV